MLFQETNVASNAEVVDAIAAFATALGWTVSANADYPTYTDLKQPSSAFNPTPVKIAIGSDATTGNRISVIANMHNNLGLLASDAFQSVYPPLLADRSGYRLPAKVTVFGGTTPGPWMAAVIHYEFNRYRHIYLGSMEPIGNYTGGECFHITNSPQDDTGTEAWTNGSLRFGYLFAARNTGGQNGVNNAGGVRIVHADNPTTWRKFCSSGRFTAATMNDAAVGGGFGDGTPNDPFFWRAQGTYASAKILVPFNLFATESTGHIRPIGRPVGVRFVHMQDVVPEQTLDVGGVNWRAYPQIRNGGTTQPVFYGSNTGQPWNESTGVLGVAYLENGP